MNTNDIVKREPISLHNVPEEIADHIALHIKSWAEVEEDAEDEEKIKGRRLRDSALAAVAQTSSGAYRLWESLLLQNVTLKSSQISSFSELVIQDPQSPSAIKSLFITLPWIETILKKMRAPTITERSPDSPWAREVAVISEAIKAHIFEKANNLETLVIKFRELCVVHFTKKVNGRSIPLPFTQSLRRLHLFDPLEIDKDHNTRITAQEAVWVFCFCPLLHSLILPISITTEGENFLAEHSCAFQNRSNVRNLAMMINFSSDRTNPRTWWGTSLERSKVWDCGSRKSSAIYHLLKVNSQLKSLELGVLKDLAETDKSLAWGDCLSGLRQSSNSLSVADLSGLFANPNGSKVDYSAFRVLKIITLQPTGPIHGIYPESLRVFIFYYADMITESDHEDRLSDLLLSNSQILELVVRDFEEASEVWRRRTEKLKKMDPIASGKVKLTTLSAGQKYGDSTKGERCLSVFDQVSPFHA